MHIDGKIDEGYVIICKDEHVFVQARLGLYVECPRCGSQRISADLAMEYLLSQSAGQSEPTASNPAFAE